MAQKWISRLKRVSRLRRAAVEAQQAGSLATPLLSVVVPVFDAGERLAACLEGLLAQAHPRVEVIVVDDGSTDGSRRIAETFAERHSNVRLLERAHAGVGAARNAGAAAAHGDFLAFCDADDVVLENGYARLVRALEASGSDIAVGSVTVQTKGRHVEPDWARRSNPVRRLGERLEDVPEVMENLILGCRVFRTSFWRAGRLRFDPSSQHAGVVAVVDAMLKASTVDVLPAVVYRWHWREDGRSLLQRSLVDREEMTDRVARLGEAGELLGRAPEPVRRGFFAGVLHTTVPDLVRSAVARDDDYWSALSEQLRRLLAAASTETLTHVPVEDRLIVWLCAHDLRTATERFLEYAFESYFGYPFRAASPRPQIALPFIDAVKDVPEALITVAASDMPYRTRLTALRWLDDQRLFVQGGAFIEYVDDSAGQSVIDILLVDRSTGEEIRIPTRPDVGAEVNQWAGRAHEDHAMAGFSAVVDTSTIPVKGDKVTFEVQVSLSIGPHRRRGPFETRRAAGSAGLLEGSTYAGWSFTPSWRPFDGLRLLVARTPAGSGRRTFADIENPTVTELEASDGVVMLHLVNVRHAALALVGPRARSPWIDVPAEGPPHSVRVPLRVDEWGLGATLLPEDQYDVQVRVDGQVTSATASRELWRTLPRRVTAGEVDVTPLVSTKGLLSLQITPKELRQSRARYLRRRLRDIDYPKARQEPLLDIALFETFAGKSAGDNPGAICSEFARRDTGVELVFSVLDRSVQVPQGSRAVVRQSPEWFELLGRSRYLITNAALPYFFRKREGQLYLQTWHGTPLKRIAHDRPHIDFLNWHHSRRLLTARDGWDFLLSQSAFCTRALTSAFRYNGPVLEVGYPRNDILTAPDAAVVRRRVRDHFGIADDQRLILYAPTWRDNLRVGPVYKKVLYLETERLSQDLADTVVLVRGHYNSVGAAEETDPARRVIDVTRYPDIADLYLAVDALVTDYSSVFFDFAITDKPMVFLAPDLVEYRDENRGFYLDYHDTVPGPVCLTTDEVIEALEGPDQYTERRAEFRGEFTPMDDGKASARVADAILSGTQS